MDVKVGIITQARMTSSRLPKKILMEVEKKSLFKIHIDRLKKSELPIFIATTTNDTDRPIVDFAEREKINIFRGSEDNVLSRYFECAKKNSLNVIIRVTSDCPLIDGDLIKRAFFDYIECKDENLYLSNCLKRTFPRGFDFELFSFSMLEDAYKNAIECSDLEHVTPYINQNKSGKVNFKNVFNDLDRSDIRITVDTKEDFDLVKLLIGKYGADKLSYREIIAIFDNNPELKNINSHIEQKKL